MRKGIFYGSVKDGKVLFDNRSIFDLFVKNYEGERIEITVEKEQDNWTLQQFRYLYSCVYLPLAEHTGHSIEEIDGVLKRKHLIRNKGTKWEYIKSKAALNRKELSDYIDLCIQTCAEVGIVCLPSNKFKGEPNGK